MEKKEEKYPLVSVVMPVHNGEKYLEQAMESVYAQQGDFKIELIVINDASTDHTREIVEKFSEEKKDRERQEDCACSLVYLENPRNLGVAESRNLGIRKASGNYIAFLDADDWWSPEKLKKQVAFMQKRDVVLCATGRELMQENGEPTGKVIGIPSEITYHMLLRTNSIPCSSVLLKASVAREFYMCHDELHEDYILWLNILKKYQKAHGINEPMLKSRLSKGGKSRNKVKSARMQYGVYRYMGYGRIRSVYYFFLYAWNGIRKYM